MRAASNGLESIGARPLAWVGLVAFAVLVVMSARPPGARGALGQPENNIPTPPGAAPTLVRADTTADAAPQNTLFTELARLSIPCAEIVDYDPVRNVALVTGERGVSIVNLGVGADPRFVRTVDVIAAAAFPRGLGASVTSVAIDPLGRGFALASVSPKPAASVSGRLVFFSVLSGQTLAVLDAGFNPDQVKVTRDGRFALAVNEGEPSMVGAVFCDPPGSISVVTLDAVTRDPDTIRALRQRDCATVYPGGVSLAVGGRDLRIHPHNRLSPAMDLEPETMAIVGDTVYVAIQENNAVGRFDLATMAWTRIDALGVIDQTIDASDRDGGAHVDDLVTCLFMPDTIGAYTVGDGPHPRTLLVTCNEGDERGDAIDAQTPVADSARLLDLARLGRLDAGFIATSDLSERGLGRLHVCAYSGDADDDGLIDRPRALGARSISVWDAQTMTLIADTGSLFERTIAERFPHAFNAGTSTSDQPDLRSDDRGPEPEGLAIGQVAGRTLVFFGLERPGLIGALDVTDPTQPHLVDLTPVCDRGDRAPEGLRFIGAQDTPSGEPILLVAYEASGTLGVYRVNADALPPGEPEQTDRIPSPGASSVVGAHAPGAE